METLRNRAALYQGRPPGQISSGGHQNMDGRFAEGWRRTETSCSGNSPQERPDFSLILSVTASTSYSEKTRDAVVRLVPIAKLTRWHAAHVKIRASRVDNPSSGGSMGCHPQPSNRWRPPSLVLMRNRRTKQVMTAGGRSLHDIIGFIEMKVHPNMTHADYDSLAAPFRCSTH